MNKYDLELQQLTADFEKQKDFLEKKSAEIKTHEIPEDVREVAEFLHSKMCGYNHADACDWYYDDGSWSVYSRKEYLEKARKSLKLHKKNVIIDVVSCIFK